MIESSSDYSRVLIPVLNKYGYSPENLTLLGTGSEGAVYSTTTHIFKFFFKGNKRKVKGKSAGTAYLGPRPYSLLKILHIQFHLYINSLEVGLVYGINST